MKYKDFRIINKVNFFILILPSILGFLNFSFLNANVVRVGIYNNPPKVLSDENGKPSGIFIDILKDIATKEGWKLEYHFDTWENCLSNLEDGKIDILPDVAYSDVRSEKFTFNKIAVLSSWLQFYSKKGHPLLSLKDLKGKKIAVLKMSIQEQVCDEMNKKLNLNMTLIKTSTYDEAVELVRLNKADFFIAGRFYKYVIAKHMEPTPFILETTTLHYAVKKGYNENLLFTIDRHLNIMLNEPNSIYYKSLDKWLSKKPAFFIPDYVIYIIFTLILISIFLFFATIYARWKVFIKTKELRVKNQYLQNIIKELQMSEERVKSLLTIKENLLHELSHRIRNIISIISSLLYLKAKNIENVKIINFVKDIEWRLTSISIVYKFAYQSMDLSTIKVKEFIDELIKASFDFYPDLRNKIEFKLEIEEINLLIDLGLPLGMVLNELIKNSFEHAFSDNSTKGIIEISMRRKNDEVIIFSFSDNGKGVSADFDFRNQKTFGINFIIKTIENQLQGKIDFIISKGLGYLIEFPTNLYFRRI